MDMEDDLVSILSSGFSLKFSAGGNWFSLG